MKARILYYLFAISLIISTFNSCDFSNTEEGEGPEEEYLVSYEKVNEYLPDFITALFNQLSAGNYPELDPIIDKVQHGVTVYKISYNTTFNNENKIASGLVCVPTTLGEFPVLSYQNGTNTQHSKAPSVNPTNELFLMLEFVTSTGFIVTIPDYLGFGTSANMFHPYLDRVSTVQTVIDMQHATRELVENYTEIDMSKDLYIAGYSQGGWATLQVQKEIETNNSTSFNLKASSCGAGPYDLNYINNYVLGLEEYPMPYFLGYIFNSYYNLELITTAIDDVFMDPYDSRILSLYDGTKSGDEINNELTTKIPMLFTEDYITNYSTDSKYSSIKLALEDNSIDAWATTTPTMLLHGTQDTFVPPMVTNKIYQNFLLEGVGNTVTMIPLQGEDHQSGILKAGVAQISWFLSIKDGAGM